MRGPLKLIYFGLSMLVCSGKQITWARQVCLVHKQTIPALKALEIYSARKRYLQWCTWVFKSFQIDSMRFGSSKMYLVTKSYHITSNRGNTTRPGQKKWSCEFALIIRSIIKMCVKIRERFLSRRVNEVGGGANAVGSRAGIFRWFERGIAVTTMRGNVL